MTSVSFLSYFKGVHGSPPPSSPRSPSLVPIDALPPEEIELLVAEGLAQEIMEKEDELSNEEESGSREKFD